MSNLPKRPALQWYPGDHRRDTALQACPSLARAIWRDMRDLMHDGAPYGHLTAGGQPIDARELARMIGGVTPRQVREALEELEKRQVFSRTAEGIIYSSRMVRDEKLRNARAAGGIKALQHPNVPKPRRNDADSPAGKDTFLPSSVPSSGGGPSICTCVCISLFKQH